VTKGLLRYSPEYTGCNHAVICIRTCVPCVCVCECHTAGFGVGATLQSQLRLLIFDYLDYSSRYGPRTLIGPKQLNSVRKKAKATPTE
jgi:hypothetical protein